jgi:hypothetical protein
MKFFLAILTLAGALLSPLVTYGQDTPVQVLDENERAERREALKGLSAEEREARRSEMRARFENLSDEERAAIQQRRQARAQNHQREHRILRQAKRRSEGANSNSSPETSSTPPAQ